MSGGPFGLTPAGFVGKTATESKADLDAAFKQIYGESIGSEPDGSIPAASAIGQEVALLVDSESGAWERQQAIYAGYDPDEAVTPQLQVLCALTGTRQKTAAYSSAVVTCFGVAGTTLPVERVLKVVALGTRFDSLAEETLALVAATWATSTAYALYDLVTANGKVWQCTTAGTSASGGGGPSGAVGSTQTDGDAEWLGICADTLGVALVGFQAEETGPLAAAVGELSEIATPISGWQGATNAAAASLGRNLEGVAALRARRLVELQAQGGGPADSIRAKILAVEEVIDCKVFVNDDDTVNGDGVPAHGVEVLILAPTVAPTANADLALLVWRAVGAGTPKGGNLGPFTVTDASDNPQSVKFSRPSEVNIYIVVTVYYDATKWQVASPSAAITAATKSALMTFGADYEIGENVRMIPLASAVKTGPQATEDVAGVPTAVYPAPAGSTAMPGVVDVLLYMGTSPSPATSTPITIGLREIARFDPARITVTATPETP